MKSGPVESATLIVLGHDFDPAAISSVLGWQPSQAWRKGDRKTFSRADGTQGVFDGVHEWSGWKLFLQEPWRSCPLSEQLEQWAASLGERATALEQLRRGDVSLELNCCVVTDATAVLVVPPTLLARLAALGVSLSITFYSHGDDVATV